MTAPAFNDMLHALRGDNLRRMPSGAGTVLSAGCAGRWYFDWIAEHYPGIRRHIGVERYSPKPADLPESVDWISDSVADMQGVPSESVDLVFSGQNIEHLQVAEIGAFLSEARRVLRHGGWLVMDSPNRAVTERLGWFQPEHVVEFRVDEIKDIVELAGFDIESIRGVWQCYDPTVHRLLPLDPDADDAINRQRAHAAESDPENAFVWWLTARKGERGCDRDAVERRVSAIAAQAFALLPSRFKSQIGRIRRDGLFAEAVAEKGAEGYVVYGPYVPLFPGRYQVVFRVRVAEPATVVARMTRLDLGHVDVSSAYQKREIAMRRFSTSGLSAKGADGYCSLECTFELTEAVFGVEFRAFTTGRAALGIALPVQLTRLQ